MANREKPAHTDTLFDRAIRWLALSGGVVLLAMVGLTVADVALRKLANAPIFGVQNVSELALLVVVFAAIPYCGRTKGHVAIDLVGGILSPRILRTADALINLVGAGLFIVLAWRAIRAAEHALEIGRVSNLLAIPHWPFYGVIALGAVLYAAVQLSAALRAAGGREPDVR